MVFLLSLALALSRIYLYPSLILAYISSVITTGFSVGKDRKQWALSYPLYSNFGIQNGCRHSTKTWLEFCVYVCVPSEGCEAVAIRGFGAFERACIGFLLLLAVFFGDWVRVGIIKF